MPSNSVFVLFSFQAEDGIRDLVRSRGLGDVYKRQRFAFVQEKPLIAFPLRLDKHRDKRRLRLVEVLILSLIHI